ncbi:2'-5' RNA ligase family protein [Paractinoplanes durhamensis]|uniref:2'-5' RNA ligase family protein n=1 Tax=Paractinoplanes durhamensis TaxID=113563 RepID=UPI00364131B0
MTRASTWHVTLVFLGLAPPAAVASILDGLPASPRFSLRLTGARQLGQAACARVADSGALGELREQVREALTRGGFPPGSRPYQPHLTVTYRSDRSIREALTAYDGAAWPVTEFALVSSQNGEYTTLRTWALA